MIKDWSDRFIYLKRPMDKISGIMLPRSDLKYQEEY